MKRPESILLDFHAETWVQESARRILLWLCIAGGSLALWSTICLSLLLPYRLYLAAFILAASALPVILLWPLERRRFLLPLREGDREASIEAWLEAPEGAARPLVEARALESLHRLGTTKRSRRRAFAGLKKPLIFLAAALLAFEATSFIILHGPVLVWSGPPAKGGSGLRIAGSEGRDAGASGDAVARAEKRLDLLSGGEKNREGDSGSADSQNLERLREARGTEGAKPSAKLPSLGGGEGEKPGGSGRSAAPGTEQKPGGGAEGKAASPGEPGFGGSGLPQAGTGTGETGYEGRGASGVPSPLLDYRSKLYEALAAKEGRQKRSTGELSEAELPAIQARFFASFTLDTGLGAGEDSWLGLVKRRWAELLNAKGGK